jgi:glucokinase
MQTVVGVDIGGTTIKLAVVRAGTGGERHQILRNAAIDTHAQEPGDRIVARLANAVRTLATEAKATIAGVGVGCPGLINNVTGEVVTSANLPSFRNFPLSKLLSQDLGVPVALQNDANAAALGEFEFGASARGCRNMVLLTLGTGVGGGVICDGHLLTGADNAAAELGHVKVEFGPDAPPCGCGGRGCIETYAGIAGIARIATAILAETPSPKLATGTPSTKAITQAAKEGDAVAKQILHTVGVYLGRGIASFIDIFNPEKVILAGGASRATEFYRPGIQQSLVQYCSFAMTRDRTRIEASALPDDINVLGAAAVFLNSKR